MHRARGALRPVVAAATHKNPAGWFPACFSQSSGKLFEQAPFGASSHASVKVPACSYTAARRFSSRSGSSRGGGERFDSDEGLSVRPRGALAVVHDPPLLLPAKMTHVHWGEMFFLSSGHQGGTISNAVDGDIDEDDYLEEDVDFGSMFHDEIDAK